MRTTLDIDEDILEAAKELGRRRGRTAGQIVSDLLRQALRPAATEGRIRNGVPLITRRHGAPVMTMALVNQLRDET